MSPWDVLAQELDEWRRAGRRATLWWRDDDAYTVTSSLEHLLAIAGQARLPLALAVVPAKTDARLACRVAEFPSVGVLQHGYSHRNHAPPGEKRRELSAHRPAHAVRVELERGRRELAELFGPASLPVLVPPWNRIDAAVAAELGAWGFTGLSTYGPRARREAAPGVLQVDTHADVVDWRGTRGFAGVEAVLAALRGHLAARRAGTADAEEPTGLLTHHLVLDAAAWDFVQEFGRHTQAHDAVHWLHPREVFAAAAKARSAPGAPAPGR